MIDPERAKGLGAALIAPGALVAAAVAGAAFGLGTALLVLAFAALFGAILLFWSSLERLTGESPLTLDEAIGLGAPSVEEERKRAIVRALKDLEYERSVGKLSEADYAELSSRYRAEARALLRALDAELSPSRKAAEARLADRLSKAGLPAMGTLPPGDESPGRTDSQPPGEPVALLPDPGACASCSTKNDADASFCKKCGARLEGAVP